MKKTSELNRREFVKTTVKVTTGVLASIPIMVTNSSSAQDLPVLAQDDPLAVTLAYTADTTTVSSESYPNHTNEQVCSTCVLSLSEAGAEFGPCSIFPGKFVAATGWCSLWAIKPAAA